MAQETGYCTRTCIVTIALVVLIPLYCSSVADGTETCTDSTYLDQSTSDCTQCTDCEGNGLLVYRNCTSNSDTVCYLKCPQDHYYNNVTGECSNCSVCSDHATDIIPCNAVHDTVCHTCNENEFYNQNLSRCSIDCSKCLYGCDSLDPTRCACAGDHQFYSHSLKTCLNCTTCSSHDHLYPFQQCTATSDTVCRRICPPNHFYNSDTSSCRQCSNCTGDVRTQCTITSDTQCCHPNEFFNPANQDCTPDCSKCPLGKCKPNSLYQCVCKRCQTGPLCNLVDPNCDISEPTEPPVDSATRPTESESTTITPVASALIALGAVIGIILFSALFVLLGVFSSCNKNSSSNDSTSSNSSDRILDDSKASSLLILMSKDNPMTYNEYKASMDFLKLSTSGRSLSSISSGSSSSPRISPKSVRTCSSKYRDNKDWSPV